MEINEIKNFLRIDFDDDDSYIELLEGVAKEYIADAIGNYDDNIARHKLLLLFIISNLYENRQYAIEKANEKIQYTLRSMVLQLQLGGGGQN